MTNDSSGVASGYLGKDFLLYVLVNVYSLIVKGVGFEKWVIAINIYLHMNVDTFKKLIKS